MSSSWLYLMAAALPLYCSGQQQPIPLHQAKQAPGSQQSAGPAQMGMGYWLSSFPVGERIFGIQADIQNPDILYACTHQGLYSSPNGGMTWYQNYGANATSMTLAQSTSLPNVMYLGVGAGLKGAVLKSLDRGKSWQPIGVQDIQQAVQSIQVSPQSADIVYVASGSTLYKSQNGGRTWGDLAPKTGDLMTFVAMEPLNPNHLIVADRRMMAGANLTESTDGGATWQSKSSAVITVSRQGPTQHLASKADKWRWIMFHPKEQSLWLALVQANGWPSADLVISRDGGSSWDDISIPEKDERAEIQSLTWSLKTPGTIYAGTFSALFVSWDYGRQWSRILPYATTGILAQASGDLYAVTEVGLLKSRNGGRNWHLSALGLPTAPGPPDCNLQAIHGDTVYVGCRDGFWATADGGLSWSWHAIPSSPPSSVSADILPRYKGANMRKLLVANDNTLYVQFVSEGGAQVLKVPPSGTAVSLKTGVRAPNMIGFSPADSSVLYMSASEGFQAWSPTAGPYFMKSDDGGFSWETFDFVRNLRPSIAGTVGPFLPQVQLFAVAPQSSKIVYVSVRGGGRTGPQYFALETTSDGGATWRDVLPDAIMPGARLQPGGRIEPAGDLGDAKAICIDPKDARTVYLAFSGGVFRSVDGGSRWVQLPYVKTGVNDVAVSSQSSQVVYIATDVGTVVTRDAGASTSSLPSGLNQEKLKRIWSVGRLTAGQGDAGIFLLTDTENASVRLRWRQLEDNPESAPIGFPPVIAAGR